MALSIQSNERTALVAGEKFELFKRHSTRCKMPRRGRVTDPAGCGGAADNLLKLRGRARRTVNAERDTVNLRPQRRKT